MLKSRRGLLAAGLAVAVVGTIGVASTINAGAEEITEPPAAAPAGAEQSAEPAESAAIEGESAASAPAVDVSAASAAPILDTKAKPPALLPWGSRPKKVKKGRAGLSSNALRGTGAHVAAADTSGAVVSKPRLAPKGRTTDTTFLRSEVTDAPPPAPAAGPGEAKAKPTTPPPPIGDQKKNDVHYLYSLGRQEAEAEGAFATLSINKPALSRYDYHSLAELAVQSKDGKQIVEIGWTVDRLVNGDDDPHLFVYHWVNRKPSCYNACGFVQHSKNIKPGDTLVPGVPKKFGILYTGNAWWVAYDSEYIGYFPETLWNDEGIEFDRAGLVQVFGEVAATEEKPCSEMGTGKNPLIKEEEKDSAYVSGFGFTKGPPSAELEIVSTNQDYFKVMPISGRTFRCGGPAPAC